MPEGTPIDGSQERISSIDGPKIRFWHEEAVKQGMKSHERPVIILSDTMSATSYLPSKPVQYSSMSGLLCELRRDLCRAPAIEIVDEAGINWISIKIQFERGTNSRSRVVLLVVVSDTSRQELWEETTISLYEMLYVQNATNLDIILKAPDEPEERCFAIAYDHPLIPTWDERLKEPICEFLQRQHYHWTTMSVFQYGTSPDTAKPTVVVSVANLQEEDIPALEGDRLVWVWTGGKDESRLCQVLCHCHQTGWNRRSFITFRLDGLSPTHGSPLADKKAIATASR